MIIIIVVVIIIIIGCAAPCLGRPSWIERPLVLDLGARALWLRSNGLTDCWSLVQRWNKQIVDKTHWSKIPQYFASWLRTNGVNTNGAAAKVMNDLWQIEGKVTPWHFWEDKSRLTEVHKKFLCQKKWNLQWPISADPICPFPSSLRQKNVPGLFWSLSGWRNAVGSLIQIRWAQKDLWRASICRYMREKRSGPISSNSRCQTILFHQYSANLLILDASKIKETTVAHLAYLRRIWFKNNITNKETDESQLSLRRSTDSRDRSSKMQKALHKSPTCSLAASGLFRVCLIHVLLYVSMTVYMIATVDTALLLLLLLLAIMIMLYPSISCCCVLRGAPPTLGAAMEYWNDENR